ncbi:MAG: hypothetical protein EOP21_02470, partial [Hyphomicrobiales bacterium]
MTYSSLLKSRTSVFTLAVALQLDGIGASPALAQVDAGPKMHWDGAGAAGDGTVSVPEGWFLPTTPESSPPPAPSPPDPPSLVSSFDPPPPAD